MAVRVASLACLKAPLFSGVWWRAILRLSKNESHCNHGSFNEKILLFKVMKNTRKEQNRTTPTTTPPSLSLSLLSKMSVLSEADSTDVPEAKSVKLRNLGNK
jgi:hypothetical protein